MTTRNRLKMRSKSSVLLGLSVLTLILVISGISAATLAEWDLASNASAANVNANVNAGDFTKGSGVTGLAYDIESTGGSATTWPKTTALDSTKYLQISIAPKTGYNLTISNVIFNRSRASGGPTNYSLYWSTSSTFTTTSTFLIGTANSSVPASSGQVNESFSKVVTEGTTLYLRWFAYNASSTAALAGRFYLDDIIIQGTVTATGVSATGFCDDGAMNITDLALNVDISNTGEGDDSKWIPLDTIEVEVELENDKDGVDLNDVVFELGLFEEGSDTNIADDMIWISADDEEFEFGDIDENEDGKHTFEFKIDPAEVDSGNYLLKVKAYPSGDENDICIDSSSDIGNSEFGSSEYYAAIDIDEETDRDKMIVVDEDALSILSASCGQEVILSLDVWNIGNRDFKDQFMVSLLNSDLGVNLEKVSFGDLDAGDDAEVDFSFRIPGGAAEGTYTLSMNTFYDYDENDGKYRTHYDRKSDSTFKAFVTVKGNCVAQAIATVSASLESEAKAGEDLVVKVTVVNTGDETVTYTANAAAYAEWASSATLDQPGAFTLASGESEEVLFTFDVKSDASGEKLFNIELVSEGEFVLSQQVSVIIEKAGFFNITGAAIRGNTSMLALGLLNVILIILIIVVAVRAARK